MSLRLDVIRDETRPPLRGDTFGMECRALVISVVGVKKGKDRAGVPKNAASHLSMIACLSRAPGAFPPLRPAPTSRNIGWSLVSGGTSLVTCKVPLAVRACLGINRRPPFLILWIEPRRISRQTVEREIPIALPASSTLTSESSQSCAMQQTYHCCSTLSNVSGLMRFRGRRRYHVAYGSKAGASGNSP